MLEKLEQIEKNYEEINEQLSAPDVTSDIQAYTKLMRQHRSSGRDCRKISRSQKDERGFEGREGSSRFNRR